VNPGWQRYKANELRLDDSELLNAVTKKPIKVQPRERGWGRAGGREGGREGGRKHLTRGREEATRQHSSEDCAYAVMRGLCVCCHERTVRMLSLSGERKELTSTH
jgi:hypothetical protein